MLTLLTLPPEIRMIIYQYTYDKIPYTRPCQLPLVCRAIKNDLQFLPYRCTQLRIWEKDHPGKWSNNDFQRRLARLPNNAYTSIHTILIDFEEDCQEWFGTLRERFYQKAVTDIIAALPELKSLICIIPSQDDLYLDETINEIWNQCDREGLNVKYENEETEGDDPLDWDAYFASLLDGKPFWKSSLLVFPKDSAGRKVEIIVHRSKVCVQRCVCEGDDEFVAKRRDSLYSSILTKLCSPQTT